MSVEIPERVAVPAAWDDAFDVVVVGLGGAGASAALEAADSGAQVLVLERFHGGGTTSVSGGIVYAGGGTTIQREAGFEDAPEAMFRYLRREVNGTVTDATLRHFAHQSAPTVDWLQSHGVPFHPSFCPFKTSYPTDDYYLYYSGNEAVSPYAEEAEPAPRGHRAHGPGLSGGPLMTALVAAVTRHPRITVRCQARVRGLVQDDEGRVAGVEYTTFPEGSRARRQHAWTSALSYKWSNYSPFLRRYARKRLLRLERQATVICRVEATGGVVLASGGFIRNRKMVQQYAPSSPRMLALGSVGDDGFGIRLGQSAGGSVGKMERISAWRFYNPPVAFVKGVLVDQQGRRICNEALYGATVGRAIVAAGNQAWLVCDATTRAEVWQRLRAETVTFQRLTSLYLLTLGHKRAPTIAALANRLAMPQLSQTIETYNAGADAGEDALQKSTKVLAKVERGPFYAMDVSIRSNPFYPCPSLTLGGLRVDEVTGRVLRDDDSSIPGLYAAGRAAVGICSEGYVSGLAIADAVYSGRRAGRVAAGCQWRDDDTQSA